MIKYILENYLHIKFPESDLNTSFSEINTTVGFFIWLDLYPLTNHEEQGKIALDRAIEVFYAIFSKDEPIWILISEWNMQASDYDIDQFANKTHENCSSWVAYDQNSECNREQVFMTKSYEDINLINLFTAIINTEFKQEPRVDSRIYFIDPKKDIIFLMWDGRIYIGSNKVENIRSYYHEFYPYITSKDNIFDIPKII